MSDPRSAAPSIASLRARLLRDPASLILLGANLVPLAGVLFWGWDAFVLLMLYWLETGIIGFWMLVRIATATAASLSDIKSGDGSAVTSPLGLSLFFIVHAGLFMGVHFVFLWTLFSGDWAGKIHGPIGFVRVLVIATGLWLPLLVLFVARGIVFLYERIGAWLLARLNRWRGRGASPAAVRPADPIGGVIGAFYARIVVMQIAIIGGGFLSFLGTIAPLILLIAIKTAIDLSMHAFFELGDADRTFKALLAAREQSVRQRAES